MITLAFIVSYYFYQVRDVYIQNYNTQQFRLGLNPPPGAQNAANGGLNAPNVGGNPIIIPPVGPGGEEILDENGVGLFQML